MAKYTFTEEEKEKVKEAVQELEKVSCGEIVPYFTQSSDDYTEASWYLSTMAGIVLLVLFALGSYFWLLPFRLTPFELSLITMSVMAVAFLLPMVFPVIKRWIISEDRQNERVMTRAKDAFLQENVFNTEERVGILIYISRLEHKVIVLGDEGINASVEPEDWQHVLDEIISGIKSGQIASGIVNAISLCKELLLKNGFERKSSDFNELDDGLRIED